METKKAQGFTIWLVISVAIGVLVWIIFDTVVHNHNIKEQTETLETAPSEEINIPEFKITKEDLCPPFRVECYDNGVYAFKNYGSVNLADTVSKFIVTHPELKLITMSGTYQGCILIFEKR
ncbi:MAG: hypothetical protein LBI53_08325 [Candidatus Peribacteria bacterium]|jgi:hypothetical protein|nr:hypothetical protein [Candidatus Peribacteria bacterium]